MALHIVNVTREPGAPPLNAQGAQYLEKVGKLLRLAKGVYCDAADREDLSGFMRKNALRIANHLYPETALIQASAYCNGPVEAADHTQDRPNYKLFLGGTYIRTTKLQYLEIVQKDTLKNDRVGQYCLGIEDEQEGALGPLDIKRSSDELVFLMNFGRQRFNLERFLSDATMVKLCDHLQEKHGTELIGRLRMVADDCADLSEELDRSIEYIYKRIEAKKRLEANDGEEVVNNVHEFIMGWHNRPVAKIVHNGVTWRFDYDEHWFLPLSAHESKKGAMPPFIQNLFPEGYQMAAMQSLMNSSKDASIFSHSERYLTNISIVKDAARLKAIPKDYLGAAIVDHADQWGVFQGTLSGIPDLSGHFLSELNRLITDIGMPRMSGNQAKIPCYLAPDGTLSPACNLPFTHILKLPGLFRDTRNLKGAMEWSAMTLARGGGLITCDFAMVELQNGVLAYVAERFDIRRSKNDHRMIFSEDFCSASGQGPNAKMLTENGVIDLLDTFRDKVTDKEQDAEQLMRLIYTNYLLENADFHMKNAALVRVASPELEEFMESRLSPAYDIMNTRYFVDLPMPPSFRETMVLDFQGKSTNYTPSDFAAMGAIIGLSADRVDELMYETAHGIAKEAVRLAANLPSVLDRQPEVKSFVLDSIVRALRCCHIDFPEIDPELPQPNTSAKAKTKTSKSRP